MAQTFFPIDPVRRMPAVANTWWDVDVSGDIPEGATGVVLHSVNTSANPHERGFRKNGSTDDRRDGSTHETSHCWAMIGVDGSRIFEAYVGHLTEVDVYLVGYTMAGVTFATNGTSKIIALDSWEDIDCSVQAPNAIGLIWEIRGPGIAHAGFGFRKNGSADDRTERTRDIECRSAIIGCDESQICEAYLETVAVEYNAFIWLVGYVTDGATFNLNATNLSLDTADAWTDLDPLPEGAIMGFIEVTNDPIDEWGLRKNGSAEDIYQPYVFHPWGYVECDASQLIEGKVDVLTTDFFLVGYAEEAPPVVGLENKSANMGSKMVAAGLI